MEKLMFEENLTQILTDTKNMYYQAGSKREKCPNTPDITGDATEEQDLKIIHERIKYDNARLWCDVFPTEVVEVLVLYHQILIESYRKGLAESNSLEENSAEKKGA